MIPTVDVQVYDSSDGLSVVVFDEAGKKTRYDLRDETENRANRLVRLIKDLTYHRDEFVKFKVKKINDY